LIYPAFIVFAVIIVGFLMFIYVLPPLIAVLAESSVELPITTRILIATTNFFQKFWWLIAIFVAGSIVSLNVYSRTLNGRYVIDFLKLKIPIFGKLYRNVYMARYARNLSTLIGGGIPIVKALDSVADIVGNKIYRDILLEASQEVRNGKTIAATLGKSREIPVLVIQMTQIGESTGKLQDIMQKMAVFYEKEVDVLLRVITTLIEPLIMILLGVAVAIMVAGILLPIYNLASVA
jgi:type IV pilus assembly protein PilC